MDKFDLCVIGAGPSGFAAAMRGIDFGKKVALIEKNRVGGAGIFNGALSSKTLWELSESYKVARSSDRGFSVRDIELNYSVVVNAMHSAVDNKYRQIREQINYYQRKGDRNRGRYEISSYFLAKSLACIPVRIVQPFLFVLISYPMVFNTSGSDDYVGALFTFSSVMILGAIVGTIFYIYYNL